ncbi:MAG: Mur ligase family protein [Bacteroidales bacterium]|nr:Mur ligase family protein [Bacteroidales bacterium]
MTYHFISIGGSIMHNLAICMHLKGHKVTGSDDEIFEPAKSNLEKYGLLPDEPGWHPERITNDIDIVILGMHAKKDNPELVKAEQLGLKIMSFPEFIYENAKNKTRVVVGGSHGKTTITSIILHVMKVLDINVDYLVGANIPGYDVMVKISDNANLLVVEGDEYLTSTLDLRPKFHLYHPDIALISGIAWDHCNVFPSFDIYKDQFAKFVDTIEPNGSLVYFEPDENICDITRNRRNDVNYIPYDTPDYTVKDNTFIINVDNTEYPLKIAGKHNMQNILGAMKVCSKLGIDSHAFMNAVTSFVGAAKRMEIIEKNDHITIYRDFAHAPSKVAATVNAVREQYPTQKIVAILELHTYSSLNINFIGHYKNTLKEADEKIVFFDPHALAIKQLPMLNNEDIKSAFDDNVFVCHDPQTLTEQINKFTSDKCILLFMSSGNFSNIEFKEFSKHA